ncbi:MAG: hypothetical protein AAFX87_28245 [Bacteroidota bacterium]
MEIITLLIMVFQGLIFFAVVAVLIYLIIRRINIRQNEDFEKRDN